MVHESIPSISLSPFPHTRIPSSPPVPGSSRPPRKTQLTLQLLHVVSSQQALLPCPLPSLPTFSSLSPGLCRDSGQEHATPSAHPRKGPSGAWGRQAQQETNHSQHRQPPPAPRHRVLRGMALPAPLLAPRSPPEGTSIGFRVQGVPQKAFHT